MNVTLGFSQIEKEAVIRAYFGAGAEAEWPLCRHCAEEFVFELDAGEEAGVQVRVHCPGCANGFSWRQLRKVEAWRSMDIDYFVERLQLSQPLRCPFDDCGVTTIELPGREIEFRCPFCNRRGRAASSYLENLPG